MAGVDTGAGVRGDAWGLPLAQALDAALGFLQRRRSPLDLVDELPPHGGGERQPADGARDVDPGTTDTPHGPRLHAPAALADGVRPPLTLAELPQRAGDLLGVGDEPLRAARQMALGQLGVGQRHGVAESALARGDLLRDDPDEVRDEQTARHRLRDAQLAPLDALRDRHLALTRQQRHATHLAQVRPHQILALILLVHRQRLLGSRGRRHARRRPALDVRLHLLGALDLDSLPLELLQEHAHLFDIQIRRCVVEHLVEGEEAAFLAKRHECGYYVLTFLYQQS